MNAFQGTFSDRFGSKVEKVGYTQVPNVSLWYLKQMRMKPVDLIIIIYINSYPPKSYHAVSTISKALGIHPNTVRSSVVRMENNRLIRRIFRKGEANKFDISGWVAKNREYANLYQTADQNRPNVSIQKNSKGPNQLLDTNEDKKEKENEGDGYRRFKEARKRL